MILVLLRYLQAVGGWHGDAIRNISGTIGGRTSDDGGRSSGAFRSTWIGTDHSSGGGGVLRENFDVSRVVPTASDNRTRAFAALGCVYVRRT